MKHLSIVIVALVFLFLMASCSKDEPPSTNEAPPSPLVTHLQQEYDPLSDTPLEWTDEQLGFLSALSDKKIVGLGEATHGTREFFEAKHRIFRYLVENLGYRVFAFEADLGESIFLNEAVLTGDKTALRSLMIEKMHFWTWKTEEVLLLLEWMADYNKDKPEAEKLHYVGVDCQYNTFHPGFLSEFLEETSPSLSETYSSILATAKTAVEDDFSNYTEEEVSSLMDQLNQLKQDMLAEESSITAASSTQDFKFNLQLAEVSRQVIQVQYAYISNDQSYNYRDLYMAENTIWWQDFFDGAKMAVWAHNAHIFKTSLGASGALGYHLADNLGEDYYNIGFSFSYGNFTAVNFSQGLKAYSIEEDPLQQSMNGVFSQAEETNFGIEISSLRENSDWTAFFTPSLRMISIGSVFSGDPSNYYYIFRPTQYDYIIHIDRTKSSRLL